MLPFLGGKLLITHLGEGLTCRGFSRSTLAACRRKPTWFATGSRRQAVTRAGIGFISEETAAPRDDDGRGVGRHGPRGPDHVSGRRSQTIEPPQS